MSPRHELNIQNLSVVGGNCAGLRPGCLPMRRSHPCASPREPCPLSLSFSFWDERVCRRLYFPFLTLPNLFTLSLSFPNCKHLPLRERTYYFKKEVFVTELSVNAEYMLSKS